MLVETAPAPPPDRDEAVKSAPSDGGTLLQTLASMLSIYPHIYKKLPHDPFVDVVPVSLGATFRLGSPPVQPCPIQCARARLPRLRVANPELRQFGSPVAGSVPHFLGALPEKASALAQVRAIAHAAGDPTGGARFRW
jgi:hypothetical protein